jgi:hypothetical protein
VFLQVQIIPFKPSKKRLVLRYFRSIYDEANHEAIFQTNIKIFMQKLPTKQFHRILFCKFFYSFLNLHITINFKQAKQKQIEIEDLFFCSENLFESV